LVLLLSGNKSQDRRSVRLVRGFFALRELFGVLFQHSGHAGLIIYFSPWYAFLSLWFAFRRLIARTHVKQKLPTRRMRQHPDLEQVDGVTVKRLADAVRTNDDPTGTEQLATISRKVFFSGLGLGSDHRRVSLAKTLLGF
jgi:hypothetical protein